VRLVVISKYCGCNIGIVKTVSVRSNLQDSMSRSEDEVRLEGRERSILGRELV
jgi:hypothetical protein